MGKKTKAGQNVRHLARERRLDAVSSLAGCVGLLILTPFAYLLLGGGGIAVLGSVGLLVGSVVFALNAKRDWGNANRADQGARGEEDVAIVLRSLEQEGWKIDYNVRVKRWGDADAFLRSPKNKYFVVDAKAHKNGTVFFDGSKLARRYGRNTVHDFGKDLLEAVKGQAVELRKLRRVDFVTPILCFTQAKLDPAIKPEQQIMGVYVTKREFLVWLLRRLDKGEQR